MYYVFYEVGIKLYYNMSDTGSQLQIDYKRISDLLLELKESLGTPESLACQRKNSYRAKLRKDEIITIKRFIDEVEIYTR